MSALRLKEGHKELPLKPQIAKNRSYKGERARTAKTRKPGMYRVIGGQSGIRTLEGLAPLPVFKTGAFNHSANCPRERATPLAGHLSALNPKSDES